MKMSLLVRSGNVSGGSGTTALKRITQYSIPVQSNNKLDAIFASLEYLQLLCATYQSHTPLTHYLQNPPIHWYGTSDRLYQNSFS